MTILLIGITTIALCIGVPAVLNNAKLKADNSKLRLENQNLQYELGKTMLNNERENDIAISEDRIESIKDKFRKTSEIKLGKKATKKDVEAFYETQKVSRKKDNKLEK